MVPVKISLNQKSADFLNIIGELRPGEGLEPYLILTRKAILVNLK